MPTAAFPDLAKLEHEVHLAQREQDAEESDAQREQLMQREQKGRQAVLKLDVV